MRPSRPWRIMPIRKAQGWPSRANFQRTRNTPAVISVTTSPATPPAGPATLPIPLAICVMPRPTMKCSLASNILMAEFRTEKMATAISHPAPARIRPQLQFPLGRGLVDPTGLGHSGTGSGHGHLRAEKCQLPVGTSAAGRIPRKVPLRGGAREVYRGTCHLGIGPARR